MTFTIGRVADLRPSQVTRSGDGLRIDGTIMATSKDALDARRFQLAGLVGNVDEEAVPLTWTVDPMVDGFYRVRSAATGKLGVERSSSARFSVELDRLDSGFARPRLEVVTTAAVRTNAHSVTAPSVLAVAIPGALGYAFAESDHPMTYGAGASSGGYDADGLAIVAYEFAYAAADGLMSHRFSADIASHYAGSARVEVKFGSSHYPVHGAQMPSGAAMGWRLSNGLVRVYPTYNTSSNLVELAVEGLSGANWYGQTYQFTLTTTATALIGAGSGGVQSVFAFPRIVRNSPETCVLRLDSANYSTFITVMRGHQWVQVVVMENSSAAGDKHGWAVTEPGSPTVATMTGGAQATTDDTNGMRWQVTNPKATTRSGSTLYETANGLTSVWQLCPEWRNEVTGASGANMRDYFFSGLSWRQRVVAR